MAEAIDQRATIVYPQPAEPTPLVARSHADLAAQTGAGTVVSLPLARDGRAVGALVLETAAGQGVDEELLGILRSVSRLAGPLVALQEDAGLGALARAKRTAVAAAERLVGPGHPVTKLAAACAVVLALVLGLATGTHRVTATTVIEGEIQRAVTAPFRRLRARDAVRAGRSRCRRVPLVRLDDRDLRLEQARLGEPNAAARPAVPRGDGRRRPLPGGVLAAQIDQAEARRALVEEQLARTEIVAPFDGVVRERRPDAGARRAARARPGAARDRAARRLPRGAAGRRARRRPGAARRARRRSCSRRCPASAIGFTVVKLTPVNARARDATTSASRRSSTPPVRHGCGPAWRASAKIDAGERNLLWIWLHPARRLGAHDRLDLGTLRARGMDLFSRAWYRVADLRPRLRSARGDRSAISIAARSGTC